MLLPKSRKKTIRKSAILLCLATTTALAGCSRTSQVRGFVFDSTLANSIRPGVDNRQSVINTLGTPTVNSNFNDDVWYYVSTTVRVRPVFFPDAMQHWVMAVHFDGQGNVGDVVNYGMSDRRIVEPVGDKTPTRGKELSFFQQIFMNVGQFGGGAPPGTQGGTTGPNGSGRLPGPNGS